MLELRPYPECLRIHGEHTEGRNHPFEPGFQLFRLRPILLASGFDSNLYFSNCDCGNEQAIRRNRLDPPQDGTVGPPASEFRDDVGVE